MARIIKNIKFLNSLKTGRLNKILVIIQKDKELDLQIRNDYFNIYYHGGNILRVNSESSIHFDEKYFLVDGQMNVEQAKEKKRELLKIFKSEKFELYFENAKYIMDCWFEKHPNPERLEQDGLVISNKYENTLSNYTIIDIEYQVSILSDFHCTKLTLKGKLKQPRFDIVAIRKSDNRICVIELKKGDKSLERESGLKDHLECYNESIGAKPELFIAEISELLKQKQEFKLLNINIPLPQKNMIPEFIFAYSYTSPLEKTNYDRIHKRDCLNTKTILLTNSLILS